MYRKLADLSATAWGILFVVWVLIFAAIVFTGIHADAGSLDRHNQQQRQIDENTHRLDQLTSEVRRHHP